jgi:hypothetical protein
MASSVKANLLDDGVVDTLGSVGASGVHTSMRISTRVRWRGSDRSRLLELAHQVREHEAPTALCFAKSSTAYGDMSKTRH